MSGEGGNQTIVTEQLPGELLDARADHLSRLRVIRALFSFVWPAGGRVSWQWGLTNAADGVEDVLNAVGDRVLRDVDVGEVYRASYRLEADARFLRYEALDGPDTETVHDGVKDYSGEELLLEAASLLNELSGEIYDFANELEHAIRNEGDEAA
jgi:hypothetical protein